MLAAQVQFSHLATRSRSRFAMSCQPPTPAPARTLLVQDPSPVQERGPPKSVTVEDSFRSCASAAAAEKVGWSFAGVSCDCWRWLHCAGIASM